MHKSTIDTAFLREQVAAFEGVRPVYQVFERALRRILRQAGEELRASAIIETRVKSVSSFAEKVVRKREKYQSPVQHVTDLCGARVIVERKDFIPAMSSWIHGHFTVAEADSEDVIERLREREFGYLAVHFVVAFKAGTFNNEIETALRECRADEGWREPPVIITPAQLGPCGGAELWGAAAPLDGTFKAEIQLCTLLQHAWATNTHEEFYKGKFDPPKHLERESARIAAQLEEADEAFVRLGRELAAYHSYHGPYRKRQARLDEIERLRAIREYDKENLTPALAIARLAISVKEWARAQEVLEPFVQRWEKAVDVRGEKHGDRFRRLARDLDATQPRRLSPYHMEELERQRKEMADPRLALLLMDYGVALWKLGQRRGRKYLLWSTIHDAGFLDAMIALGDTYLNRQDRRNALEWFNRAFQTQPTDPRALRKYVHTRACVDRSASFVTALSPSLESSIGVCRQRARVQVYLPYAFFDIGLFRLLQGRAGESLYAYAKGISLSESIEPLEKAHGLIRQITETCFPGVGVDSPYWWASQFLLLAMASKLIQIAGEKHWQIEALLRAAKRAKQVNRAQRDALATALTEEQAAIQAARAHIEKNLVPSPVGLCEAAEADSIAIVAGGMLPTEEAKIEVFRPLFEAGFRGFRGVLFVPCTRVGTGALVADLALGPEVTRVAYEPQSLPKWVAARRLDPRACRVVSAPSSHLSPLESLQVWVDLFVISGLKEIDRWSAAAAGLTVGAVEAWAAGEAQAQPASLQAWGDCSPDGLLPARVRLLGVNGGETAGFEYRLALALGAKVGLVAESGRAARQMLEDEDWAGTSGLIPLPVDPATVRAFLQRSPVPHGMFRREYRERKAQVRHERHRTEQLRALTVATGGVLDHWEEVPDCYRRSTLEQVDHTPIKLAALGMKLNETGKPPKKRVQLTPDQIEVIAELEHGRWNAERLLDDWRWAEVTDKLKKRHNLIVPWQKLTEEQKQWDRTPMIELIRELQEEGFEIVPLHPQTHGYVRTPESDCYHILPHRPD